MFGSQARKQRARREERFDNPQRGGKAIGKTASGKVIYATPDVSEKDFDENEQAEVKKARAKKDRADSPKRWDAGRVDAGGEGSRGGKIIGRTKGGKPIYQNHNHPGHSDFSSGEHKEAEKVSIKLMDKELAKKPGDASVHNRFRLSAVHHKEQAEKKK